MIANHIATLMNSGLPVKIWMSLAGLLLLTACGQNDDVAAKRPDITKSAQAGPLASSVSDLKVQPMTISLAEQISSGAIQKKPGAPRLRKIMRDRLVLISDSFEDGLRDGVWDQATSGSLAWKASARDGATGNFAVHPERSGAAEGWQNAWLLAGPYDLSQVSNIGVRFQMSLSGVSGDQILFWGASTDGEVFQGFGVSGSSDGWQPVNSKLADLGAFDRPAGHDKLWFAFLYTTRQETDARVLLDDVEFYFEAGLRQEYTVSSTTPSDLDYDGGIGLARPAFADIDQDEDFDLFVGSYDGRLGFYENVGTKSRPDWQIRDPFYAAIDVGEDSAPAFCDLDQDGDLDLFVGAASGKIYFFRNIGTSTGARWEARGILRDETGKIINLGDTSTLTFFDVDDDGDPDLVGGNTNGVLVLYRNDTTWPQMTWRLVSEKYLGVDVGSLSSPAFADIDADGDLDLFVGAEQSNIFFYENTNKKEAVEFELASKAFLPVLDKSTITSPALVDWDADGDVDVCAGQSDGQLYFFANEGDRKNWKFQSPVTSLISRPVFDVGFQSAPVLADLDDDSDLDLAIGGETGKIVFFENTGAPGRPRWQRDDDLFADVAVKNWSTPTFVDIDHDGDLDLFTGSKLGPISFFENSGSNKHPVWRQISDAYYDFRPGDMSYPTFADIDDDGDYDLFIGTQIKGITFYQNDGSPDAPQWKLVSEDYLNLSNIYRLTPVFVDWDLDGDLDLMAGSHDGNIIYCENAGFRNRPSFEVVTTKLGEIKVRYFSTLAPGDLDGDGDIDLLLGNNSGGLYFLRNYLKDGSFIGLRGNSGS